MSIDQTVTARELGEILGITDRRVRQLHDEGVFTRAGRGQYPLAECIRAYIASIESQAEPEELRRERTRLVRAQADRMELRNQEERQDLCRVTAVMGVMSAQGSAVQEQLMTMISRRGHELAAALGVEVGQLSAVFERVIREELTAAGETATATYDRFVAEHGSLHPRN